jgi:hypothetical protein
MEVKIPQETRTSNFATPSLGDEQRCDQRSATLPRAEHLHPGRLSARPGTLQPVRAGTGHPSPGWGGGGRGAGGAGLVGPRGKELEPRPLPRYKGEEGVCRLLLQQAGPLCSCARGGWQHRCKVSAKRVSSIVEYPTD